MKSSAVGSFPTLESLLKGGGALGEELLAVYVARGWIQRHRRSRAVTITPKGHESFRRFLDQRF